MFNLKLKVLDSFCRDSAPVSIVVPGEGIVIETTTSGVKVSNLVIVLAVVGSVLVFLFLAILYFLRKRYRKKQKANKKHRGQLRTLRQLLTNMSTKEGNLENDKYRQLNQLKHVTFVFTGT
jgi:beta-lactamase regulating signal transducer with metallopeptidase domain